MYNLGDGEHRALLEWEKSQNSPVQVTLTPSDHEQSPFFEAFCGALQQCTSKIQQLKRTDGEELPAIVLSDNMVFHAIPQGKMFSSFIKALSLTPSSSLKLPDTLHISLETAANLSRIEVPVELKLYIANQCPHCPGVVNTLLSLAAKCSHIHLKIIDGTLFTEHASMDSVLSAPCLILDNEFRWTGSVTPEEVTNMIVNRDPSALSTSSLRRILEEGKADWIAGRMMEHNSIFPGFTGLVIHEIWSVRLGAMVVLEEIVEKSPDLAVQIGPEILKHFKASDIPTQGDILYALGETGDESIKQEILNLTKTLREPDLVEAAQEAIEAIEAKSKH